LFLNPPVPAETDLSGVARSAELLELAKEAGDRTGACFLNAHGGRRRPRGLLKDSGKHARPLDGRQ
jgi:hypothetical protein